MWQDLGGCAWHVCELYGSVSLDSSGELKVATATIEAAYWECLWYSKEGSPYGFFRQAWCLDKGITLQDWEDGRASRPAMPQKPSPYGADSLRSLKSASGIGRSLGNTITHVLGTLAVNHI